MYLPSIYRTIGIASALQLSNIYPENPVSMLHTSEYSGIDRFTRYLPLINEKSKLD